MQSESSGNLYRGSLEPLTEYPADMHREDTRSQAKNRKALSVRGTDFPTNQSEETSLNRPRKEPA